MKLVFGHVERFEGWSKFPRLLETLVLEYGIKRICEVGAGANPALSAHFIREQGLTYVATDEDSSELAKAARSEASRFDICNKNATLPGAPYDLICSRMTAEHFRSPENAYHNMFRSLTPGGLCVHSFACLYTLPFVVNKLLPDAASDRLLDFFAPRDRERHDKFTAYYRRCRGPIPQQIQFFQGLGYEILEYRAYFGHGYYAKRLPPLDLLHRLKTSFLLQKPSPYLTSYATIILRRPS
jgi:SAM-dependent methyltransferase